MTPFRHLVLVGFSCVLELACDFPVSDSKYEIDEPEHEFDRIVAALSSGSASCEACLRAGCKPYIDPCVETAACTEFIECVQAEANPGGQTRCLSQREDVSLAAVAAYSRLRECWLSCKSPCALGENWDCLGEYTAPQPPRATITVQQSLSYACERSAVPGAEVTLCDSDGDCRTRAMTDATGTYSLDLPANIKPTAAGWSGFRRVTGPNLSDPHRLERNLPLWSDHVESTLLLSQACSDGYISDLTAQLGPANWESSVGVQLYDCHSTGAEGVVLHVTTAPNARIVYEGRDGIERSFSEDSSKAAGEGLALVADLPPGEHQVEAKEVASGRLVARAQIKLTPGEVTVYNIFPEPVQ